MGFLLHIHVDFERRKPSKLKLNIIFSFFPIDSVWMDAKPHFGGVRRAQHLLLV